jgi:hypothetical protein
MSDRGYPRETWSKGFSQNFLGGVATALVVAHLFANSSPPSPASPLPPASQCTASEMLGLEGRFNLGRTSRFQPLAPRPKHIPSAFLASLQKRRHYCAPAIVAEDMA